MTVTTRPRAGAFRTASIAALAIAALPGLALAQAAQPAEEPQSPADPLLETEDVTATGRAAAVQDNPSAVTADIIRKWLAELDAAVSGVRNIIGCCICM